jgi:site-specific DNA-methyltransferase (adenine-specific)
MLCYEKENVWLYCGDNVEFMKTVPDDVVDLTVTSPPYDGLRTYNGYSFDFENVAKELYRITKEGGCVVWVVSDSTKNGNESGTSFKQALFFKEIGFNLHDTMIYSKGAQGGAKGSCYAYTQSFEYMFVFSKGKLGTVNLIADRINTEFTGKRMKKSTMRKADGNTVAFEVPTNATGKRTNVWEIRGGYMVSSPDKISYEHPATFPESLANDHILSWSNENDLVFDPFNGSGTTAKMAKLLKRKFMGIDISKEYVDIQIARLEATNNQVVLD